MPNTSTFPNTATTDPVRAAHLSLTEWSWEPTIIGGLAVLVALYVLAHRRGVLRPHDDLSPWLPGTHWRVASFVAGIVIAWIALQSPIDAGGDHYLFWLHMVQHLLLMMVAPPLALLGICGAHARPVGGRWARRTWRVISAPWPAVAIFNGVLLIWHIPALYDATLTVDPLHVAEHLTFIAAGVLFWWPIVAPLGDERREPVGPFEKIAMLTVAGIPPTILGLIFSIARAPLYSFYANAPRLWGLSPVADQQIAGVVMFGAGNIIYFIAISAIFLRIFVDPDRDEQQLRQPG